MIISYLVFFYCVIFPQHIVKNVIKNKLATKDVILQRELTIGERMGISNYLFEEIRTFRVDEKGNIFVIDAGANKLLKFNESGHLIWSKGKRGQGPGEFQLLLGIELSRNNMVIVYDFGNKRISFFNENGEFVKDLSVKKYSLLNRVDDDNDGFFYGVLTEYFEDKSIQSLKKFNKTFGAILKEFFQIERKRTPNKVQFISPQIFFRIRNDGLIIYANNWEYIFYLANGNGVVKKIIRNEYKPVKYTEADKKREFEERYKGRTLPPELKFIFPDYYPPIEHLLLDDQNNIFVRTYERTKEGAHYYDYFNAEGRYIASFPMKETIFCIRGDRFYTLEEDKDGYQKIVRYKYRLKVK